MIEEIDKLLEKGILTNYEITKICNLLKIKLDGVIMNNQFNINWLQKPFSIIANLENTDMTGSHWVAYYNDPKTKSIFYMDSYGEVANAKIYNQILHTNLNLYFNKKQFQDLDSVMCGWFCILFLYTMDKSKNKLKGMIEFLKLWNYKRYDANDKVIKQKILQLLKKK